MIAKTFTRTALITASALMLAATLEGCVSLLPKATPAQLYRFGGDNGAPTAAIVRPRGVILGPVEFPNEATGDGILTVRGSETAYIKGARWVSPAALLFRQAIPAAFDQSTSRTRVMTRGEIGQASGVLQLDVTRFEADYDTAGGAPTVRVKVLARLAASDGRLVGVQNFDIRKPVSENRVGAIVPVFDAATRDALSQIVAWTDRSLDAAPRP